MCEARMVAMFPRALPKPLCGLACGPCPAHPGPFCVFMKLPVASGDSTCRGL